MPLSDTALRALKPMERRYKKADQRGLYIEVEPNGSKLWRYKYRYEGVEKRIALGRYPDVSLSQARRKQEDARRLLEDGKDPSLERRRERLVDSINAENTFGGIAREYIQHKMIGQQRAEVTVAKARWLLEQLNPLANMPVAEIRAAEVLGGCAVSRPRANTKPPAVAAPSQAGCSAMPSTLVAPSMTRRRSFAARSSRRRSPIIRP